MFPHRYITLFLLTKLPLFKNDWMDDGMCTSCVTAAKKSISAIDNMNTSICNFGLWQDCSIPVDVLFLLDSASCSPHGAT